MDLSSAIHLQRQGRWKEAEVLCREGLRERPEDDRLLHQLGGIALRLGRVGEAVELLSRAVRLCPADPSHRVDLAAALGTAGRPAEALDHLQVALLLQPHVPELHNNLGVTLDKLGRLPQAINAFRDALALREQYPEAHNNLGKALRETGRLKEAAASFERALRLRPGYLKAAHGVAAVAGELGDLQRTLDVLRDLVARAPCAAEARSSLLYTLHYSLEFDAEALWREHREWGRLFCDPLKEQIEPHDNDRSAERKLRVGYVSPDLREHTVTKFVTAALEHHDPANFEVSCYSDVEKPDAITLKLKGMVEHWHKTRGMKDAALDQLIRKDQIDILVDLRGHAADNRLTLFARKPAPVQVNMVGYFDTTGLATMDYRITDEHQDPLGMTEKCHSEQLIRLPHSCWCYTADADAPDVTEPPASKNGYITFGSLNKIVKVSEPCAKLWARVMEAVPGSRLLLSVAESPSAECNVAQPPSAVFDRRSKSTDGFPPDGGTQPRAAVPQQLSQMGLPVDRVDILGKTATSREYLERFNQIDIALDTFPFNGITTTCDGLWQGVPCVSLAGGTSVSRAGRSILRAANLPELATDTPEAFVRAAVDLAGDRDRLRALRLSMRERLLASPLMDHRGFARNLETAYRQMWRSWCGG